MQFSSPPASISTLKQSVAGWKLTTWLPLVLSIIGLFLAGYGIYLLQSSSLPRGEELLSASASDASPDLALEESALEVAPQVIVEVAGAVESPGLVQLSGDSRVGDAVKGAGGFTDQADAQFINQSLNLAQVVSDAQKIYVPFVGEKLTPSELTQPSASPEPLVSESSPSALGLTSINSATEAELDLLDGIGQARAASIVQNRPYTSLDELLSKKVLSASLFESLKDQLSL